MRLVVLVRTKRSDDGSFGVLSESASGFACFTAEPPWKNNRSSVSCIPAGEYIAKIRRSPKYGIVFHLQDVEGRTYILIHAGNFAGDIEKGLKTHTHGCILLGRYRGKLNNGKGGKQEAVLASKPTVRRFMDTMGQKPFKMIIKEAV